MKRFTPFQKRTITTVFIIVTAVSGYFLSRVIGNQMRRSAYSDLLLNTQMTALLITPQEVQQLSADERDLENPTYLNIKRKFFEVKRINDDARSIYLLGLNDQKEQFVFVDSEPEGSYAYTLPGTINHEARNNDIRDHFAGATYVHGPYTRGSQEWISAYAPITNDQEEVLAMVRVDVEAQKITLLTNIISRGILLITALMVFSLMLIYINDSRKLS